MSNSSSSNPTDPESSEYRSHALLQAVLDTAVDAIITIDSRGTVLSANHAVRRMLGYASEELIGQPLTILMPEPDRSQHDGYISNYLTTGQAKIIGIGREVKALHRDGRLVPVDLAVSEIKLGDRRLFTGILRDMSERYQAQAVLDQAEQRLIQNERLAAIGQMVTGLAHESRNALQRSRACLDMLELDLANAPEQLDWVNRTKSALVELQTLYEEVRNYAAPIKLEMTEQQPIQIVKDVWRHLETQHSGKGIQLIIDNDTTIRCRCDRQRISQVIRNILENAIAVAPPESRIFVAIDHRESTSGRFVTLRFVDEGPGLNDEQCEKIFEPFFTTKTKGTGLGMAISKRIIEAHGGTIGVGDGRWINSLSPGAEVFFSLPMSS
jgi:two-component system, LuxR family, sensor kinase FixL